METIKKQVGERLRELRKRAGFRSVEALSDALGVHLNTVGAIERGESWISPEMLPELARALNVPMAALYPGFEDSITPTPEQALAVLAKTVAQLKKK